MSQSSKDISELLSDGKILGLIQGLTDANQSKIQEGKDENESLSEKQRSINKSINLISTLMPVIPEHNRRKASLIIKLLEAAIIIEEIRQASKT